MLFRSSPVDAICSSTVSVWREALGTVAWIMGGSQLCTSDGGKAARKKAVYTDYDRTDIVGTLV